MDFVSVRARSRIMSRIRGRGNKETELALAELFRQHRITGWRRHQDVFGKPDFIFPKSKLAVFVDGCFWHGCPKHGTKPKSNRAYWWPKLERNRTRDRMIGRRLRRQGWQVARFWACDLSLRPTFCINKIRRLQLGWNA